MMMGKRCKPELRQPLERQRRPVGAALAMALTRKAVEMALAGDVMALKLWFGGAGKERPLSFALPPVASVEDTAKAINGVLAALAQGMMTLGEAGRST
jgi:hypothetical protein